MRVHAKDIAQALVSLVPSIAKSELPDAIDAALTLLRRHGLHRAVRTFPNLVARAWDEQHGVKHLELTVGFGDPEESLDALAPTLDRLFSRRYVSAALADSSLIGGAVLRMGDDQIDASVRSILERLSLHVAHHVV